MRRTCAHPCILALALAACGDDGGVTDGATGTTSADTGAATGSTTGAPTTGAPTTGATDTGGTDSADATTDATTGGTTTGGTTTGGTTTGGTTTGGTTDATTDGTTDATTGGLSGAPTLLMNACAPNDGPALELWIGVAALECGSDFPEDAPIFRIVLFQGGPLGPGQYTLDGGLGFAWYDEGSGELIGSSGTLTVTGMTPLGIAGSYEVTLEDQSVRAGDFDAIDCGGMPMCG